MRFTILFMTIFLSTESFGAGPITRALQGAILQPSYEQPTYQAPVEPQRIRTVRRGDRIEYYDQRGRLGHTVQRGNVIFEYDANGYFINSYETK